MRIEVSSVAQRSHYYIVVEQLNVLAFWPAAKECGACENGAIIAPLWRISFGDRGMVFSFLRLQLLSAFRADVQLAYQE